MNMIRFLALSLTALTTMASGQINRLKNGRQLDRKACDSVGAGCCFTGGNPANRVYYCGAGYGCNPETTKCVKADTQALPDQLVAVGCYVGDPCDDVLYECTNSTTGLTIDCDENTCPTNGQTDWTYCLRTCSDTGVSSTSTWNCDGTCVVSQCCGEDSDGDGFINATEPVYCQ